MNFYTTSTFRETIANLVKKRKDGYQTVVADICENLMDMPTNILRITNDRIIQMPDYRIIKLRLPNSGLRQSKSEGFRLIYFVSMNSDDVVLLCIYPKRGAKGIINLDNREYLRLIAEVADESERSVLHKVDINSLLAEHSQNASLSPKEDHSCL